MILPPEIFSPDPYIQQVVYMFHPIPADQPLLISVCSMFNRVHAMRCLGCDQEVWQVAGDISERVELRDKMAEHVGLHMDAGFVHVQQVQ